MVRACVFWMICLWFGNISIGKNAGGAVNTGNLNVTGNLFVNGTTTIIDTENMTILDNIIEINTGVTNSQNDSGILINRGNIGDNAFIGWNETLDKFMPIAKILQCESQLDALSEITEKNDAPCQRQIRTYKQTNDFTNILKIYHHSILIGFQKKSF